MGALKKVFGNWWVLSIGAAVLLAVALAVLLPFAVALLRPLWVRLTVVAVIALIEAGLAAWRVISARKASDLHYFLVVCQRGELTDVFGPALAPRRLLVAQP